MLEVENKIKTVVFPETERDLKYLEQECILNATIKIAPLIDGQGTF